jgi:hypothetical protein
MNIIDQESWDDIYLIETSDYVVGGSGGTSNEQAVALANRTRWLRAQLEALELEIASMPTSESMGTALALKADKTYTDTELGKKADKSYADNKLALKADKIYVDDGFAMKSSVTAKSDKTYVDTELGKKADKTYVDAELGKKADKNYVDLNFLAATKDITITSGLLNTSNRMQGQLQDNWDYNIVDIYPPSGFSITHLIGFICSPAVIYFNGGVDGNDTLYCRWERRKDRVRVICQNSENRAVSSINSLAMWRKWIHP